MVKPAFYIRSENAGEENPMQHRLLMEVNAHSFSYVLLNLRGMSPAVIKNYQFAQMKDSSLEELLREIIPADEWLVQEVSEVFIVYNFEQSNLVPDQFSGPEINNELTELVYGNLEKGVVLSEKVPWWELCNVYRVPHGLYHLFQQKFINAKCWHAYSLLLKSHKMFNAVEGQDEMKVIFYTDKIVVLVFKAGQVQLIQTFNYQDRKDVLYYLLSCCTHFSLDPRTVLLTLSGFIDKHAAVYTELQKYFGQLVFDELDETIRATDELKEYPVHYFSSLLKMAVCV
jgi:hypothetical protein